MTDLITLAELAVLLTDELGENIGERRVFNAIRAQQIG
jgi:hypothetical protein